MVAQREKFSSQASPELLAEVRKIAKDDGRHFQAVLEDALRDYIEGRQAAEDPPRGNGPLPGQCGEKPSTWLNSSLSDSQLPDNRGSRQYS